MEDIRLQPVNQMQQVQAAGQENLPKDQQEKLPAYSERYYDDYFEYRYDIYNPNDFPAVDVTRCNMVGQVQARQSNYGAGPATAETDADSGGGMQVFLMSFISNDWQLLGVGLCVCSCVAAPKPLQRPRCSKSPALRSG